jgi:hypothetical protein
MGAALTPIKIADEILRIVEASAPGDPGVETRDRNDRLLVAAYGRAHRCFFSIRELVHRGEADDAEILTRALLSIALRSLYLAQPDDAEERQRRFRRAGRTYFEELLKAAREEEAEGIDLAKDVKRLEENIARFEAEGIARLPTDHDLARSLDLAPFYTRVYRPGSDVAHYSIGAALDGFLELTHEDLIGPVALLKPQPERAADVLIRAALTYGMFLERAEPIVRHGVTESVRALLVDYFDQQQRSDADGGAT